jgi:multicomponent Na+:H+ antiporter subunit E
MRDAIPLALFLFLIWFVFTEKTNWEHLLTGAVVAYLFANVCFYLLGGKVDENLTWKVLLRFPVFGGLLLWEIIKANWDVIMRVLAPSLPISPRIIEFESYLESDIAKAALANSITLTPGTVTIEIEGSKFYVHCLAAEHKDGLLEGRLERMVAWLFSEGPPQERRLR